MVEGKWKKARMNEPGKNSRKNGIEERWGSWRLLANGKKKALAKCSGQRQMGLFI
jgi:hypothetical protein